VLPVPAELICDVLSKVLKRGDSPARIVEVRWLLGYNRMLWTAASRKKAAYLPG
jgi:hypothetical protein